jgi:low affinity Fe/Cu permease
MNATPPLPNSSSGTPGWELWFARLAQAASDWSGSSLAFTLAAAVVLVWLITGPFFGYSDAWQLAINTDTTVVTFLMVFLIQRVQIKDTKAVHLKLNEMIATLEGASDRLVNVETLPEEELRRLHARFGKILELAKREGRSSKPHSIEETAIEEAARVAESHRLLPSRAD